jgi:hypothetical protein
MIVTVTSLKLKRLWGFFYLSYLGLKITLQMKRERGFIKMKNTGFGYLHYTLSAWESEEDAKRFARSGEHLKAMQTGHNLATEVKIYTYEAEKFPNWAEAKNLVLEKGRTISYK